jgi:hypothetical protein
VLLEVVGLVTSERQGRESMRWGKAIDRLCAFVEEN